MSELREIRKSLGWTQQQMADALGVSRRVVGDNETGKNPTPRERLLAARWLGSALQAGTLK